jgi:hypothetical protein
MRACGPRSSAPSPSALMVSRHLIKSDELATADPAQVISLLRPCMVSLAAQPALDPGGSVLVLEGEVGTANGSGQLRLPPRELEPRGEFRGDRVAHGQRLTVAVEEQAGVGAGQRPATPVSAARNVTTSSDDIARSTNKANSRPEYTLEHYRQLCCLQVHCTATYRAHQGDRSARGDSFNISRDHVSLS